MSIELFKNNVMKLDLSRTHEINNSIGVYDIYKAIRKSGWKGIGSPVSEHNFYRIIRTMNLELSNNLSFGGDIVFPCRMGMLELRKRDSRPRLSNGKLKVTYSVDWDKTLKLWYDDKEAYASRTLIRIPDKEIFRVVYNKNKANYNNKTYFEFLVNRDIKSRLKKNIKNNIIDAFEYGNRKN